jgi:hypothetical protein
MINKITEGICTALFTEFGTDFKIYTERVPQGFSQPSFSVKCTENTSDVFMGRRHKSTNKFQVDFYTTENSRQTANEVANRLPQALEYITFDGDKTKTLNMDVKKTDTGLVCTFEVNYFFYIIEDTEETYIMENMKTSFSRKE